MAPPGMTFMSWARCALVAVLALIVQVAVLDQILVFGAHPDLMVVLVGAAGAAGGPACGAMIGFVIGLVADLVLSTPFGLSSLTFVLIGFAAGLVHSLPGDREGWSTQGVTTVAAAAAGTALYALIGALVGQSGFLGRDALYATFVVTLGAVVMAIPAVAAMGWVIRAADGAAAGHAIPAGGSATR